MKEKVFIVVVLMMSCGVHKEIKNPEPKVEQCPEGKEIGEYTKGNCCWPGQTWAGRCVGIPYSCPTDKIASGDACVCPADKIADGDQCLRAQPGMVPVPVGEFLMGCNAETDSTCGLYEKPGREVHLDAFQIDKTEVTVDAYKACVDAEKCSAPSITSTYCSGENAKFNNWGQSGRGNHPVNCVSWYQADTYCKWAGKSLPTEAQWEKTARGTDGRKYPWGNTEPASAGKVGNFADAAAKRSFSWTVIEGYDDGFDITSPVGSFPAGPNGAYDMSGNVWEWTADWHSSSYYASSPSQNPTGPSSGYGRVFRGGSFDFDAAGQRASYRVGNSPDFTDNDLGFRCSVDGSP